MQTESGYAEVNGAQIYYDVTGAGYPLAFVHAGVADHRMWDDQVAFFADRYRVIRMDLRGFGKTKPAAVVRVLDERGDIKSEISVEMSPP